MGDKFKNEKASFNKKYSVEYQTRKSWTIWIFVALLCALLLNNLAGDFFKKAFVNLTVALTPLIIGIVIAFILKKLVNFLEDKVFKKVFKKFKHCNKISRIFSITLLFLLLFLIIFLFLWFVVPEVVNLIDELNNNLSCINIDKCVVKLDDKISLKDNALKFYKKSQKLKSSKQVIQEQIDISNNLISYYNSLLYHLSVADPIELEEIKEELVNEHIIKGFKTNKSTKKKVNFLEFELDGIKISVGRNNQQNELLTLKLAKYNEYFFHVKDYPGSHVIVHTDKLNEKLIRYAANIAAVYSSCSESSSVPVDYCLIKNVKRHPSNKLGQVIIKENKTIYIDPNKKLI